MKACGFRGGKRLCQRVVSKIFEAPSNVVDEQRADVFTNAMAHENSLYHDVLAIGLERVGRNLPATAAKTVRQIVKGVAACIEAILDRPRNRWNAGLRIAAENDLEWG